MFKIQQPKIRQILLAKIFNVGIALIYPGTCAWAQNITLDASLGKPANITGPNYVIPQSVGQTLGNNLFHSFGRFNLNSNEAAIFQSDANIINILSRVTGGTRSEIDGLIRTESGNVNFFLINPSGIIFGKNARLDVGGSFVASTANAIGFGNQGFFSATDNQPPSPLLTINPDALFFNQIQPEKIEIRSSLPAGVNILGEPISGLRVRDGRSLLVVGGDITLTQGGLTAIDGRIELAAIADSGTLGLNVNGDNLNLQVPGNITKANILFTDGAFLDGSGARGGDIRVWGKQVHLIGGSQIVTNTLGSGTGGSLDVTATELLRVAGRSASARFGSGLFAQTRGTGKGGDLTITTRQLQVQGGALISAGGFSEGNGGNLTVDASQSVQVAGDRSGLFTQADGAGNAGNLTIRTRQLSVENGARISAGVSRGGRGGNLTIDALESVQVVGVSENNRLSNISALTQGKGQAGDLTINTQQLFVKDGAQIRVSTFGAGNGGSLTINAESVQLIGTTADGEFGSGLFAQSTSTGNAGKLTVNAAALRVQNGARGVSVSTFGQGAGGNLTVNARESIQLIGAPGNSQFDSGLFAQTSGTGKAGNLIINTQQLQIQDRAKISAATLRSGEGGSITVTANTLNATNGGQLVTTTAGSKDAGSIILKLQDNLLLSGKQTGLFANTEPGSTGNGGSIFIDPRILTIQDGAKIAVDSQGEGTGGNIKLAAGLLTLDRGIISADTLSNNGGDITLNLQDLLLLRNGSQITTTAGNNLFGGNGGNITINSPFIVAIPKENSDIAANAFSGQGGIVDITTNGIFGISIQKSPTELSGITASSQLGISGEVTINTPDADPNRGLVQLPTTLVDASQQIVRGCTSKRGQNTSRFISTGRSGLPLSPNEPLRGRAVITQWVTAEGSNQQTREISREEENNPKNSIPEKIVEAQGWVVDSGGKIHLVAQAPGSNFPTPSLKPSPICD